MHLLVFVISILVGQTGVVHASQLAAGDDPFLIVEHFNLPNGIKVFLAPNPDETVMNFRVEVGVGWQVEGADNLGVSHLLEHVLFRDKQLKDEMSYLQLIKEHGGAANGTTEAQQTSYFGSIPAHRGPWLVKLFAKMILSPEITDEYVDKEKGTIELERGKPPALGFKFFDLLKPAYLKLPTFWESEFGVSFDEPFTLSEEQSSTAKLRAEHVRRHYLDYYYPGNIRLFITGRIDREDISTALETTWADAPKRSGREAPKIPEPRPRQIPYAVARVAKETPFVSIGTKVWAVSASEYDIIYSYMDYLAHRLMKEIRNKKGQTYSAQAETAIYDGFGYSVVKFQTPKENFKENFSIVTEYIEREAGTGNLTDDAIREATELYLAKFRLYGTSASSLMWFAQSVNDFLDDYGYFKSPAQNLAAVSPDEYRGVLKKYFSPERRYTYLQQPPLIFEYDQIALYVIVFIAAFTLLRRLLTREFHHDRVYWVRKIRYPPLKSFETFVLLLGFFAAAHAAYLIDLALLRFPGLQSSILFPEYLGTTLKILIGLAAIQGLISLLPKKLMVMDDQLVIKSLSYYSHRIPLAEIVAVRATRAWTYPFPLSLWLKKVRHRYFFYAPQYWQKGLLVETESGKCYFFSVTSPARAEIELRRFIGPKLKANVISIAA